MLKIIALMMGCVMSVGVLAEAATDDKADSFEEIYVPTPNGTTVWIIKKPEYQILIDKIKQLKVQ